MKTFLEKLERATERWIGIVDDQLQKTTVQVITGKVFTHSQPMDASFLPDDTVTPEAPASRPTRDPHRDDTYPPLLKKAAASQE